MYKVFVNEHLIELTDSVNFSPFDRDKYAIIEISNEEVEILIHYLFNEKQKQHVYLIFEDVDSGFNEFKKSFKIIEAAGGLVKNSSGHELFIYRLDKWDLPKGKIEKGESPEIAAIREVEEECGISELKIGKHLQSTWHVYQLKDNYILKKTFWFQMHYQGQEELIPQKEEGIERVIWADNKTKKQCLENTYPSILEIV